MRDLTTYARWVSLALLVVAAVLLVTAGLVGPAAAMGSDNFAINWDVVAGGGEPAASTNFALNGTIGQPVIGIQSSTDFELCSGYWCGAGGGYAVYLPLVLRHP